MHGRAELFPLPFVVEKEVKKKARLLVAVSPWVSFHHRKLWPYFSGRFRMVGKLSLIKSIFSSLVPFSIVAVGLS